MIINATMAINALISVVTDNEQFVYRSRVRFDPVVNQDRDTCLYTFEGRPDCGVGQALAELGMSIGQLTAMDAYGVNTQIAYVELPDDWYLTSFARQILAGFQTMQDVRYHWGEALERAKQIYVNPSDFDRYGTHY